MGRSANWSSTSSTAPSTSARPALCQIRPDVQLVDTKQYTWVVQAYGSPGYSPFSAQLTFTAAKMDRHARPVHLLPAGLLRQVRRWDGPMLWRWHRNLDRQLIIMHTSATGIYYELYRLQYLVLQHPFDELGKLSLNSTINGIAIKNDYISGDPRYIYIADGSAGIRIVDVSSTSAPAQVGAYTTANDAP